MKRFVIGGLMGLVISACGGEDVGGAGGSGSEDDGTVGPLTDLTAATMKQVATDAASRIGVDHEGCAMSAAVALSLDRDGTLADDSSDAQGWSIAFECDDDEFVSFRYEDSIEPTKWIQATPETETYALDEAPDSPAIVQAYLDAGCMPAEDSYQFLTVFAGEGGVEVVFKRAPTWQATLDASGAVVMELTPCPL